MFIYKITNLVNGKVYVGQTIHKPEYRFKDHMRANNDYSLLAKAVKKYGKENFKMEVIETLNNVEELNIAEPYWIMKLNALVPNGYNLEHGGGNRIVNKITREKMAKSQTGMKRDPDAMKRGAEKRRKMNVWNGDGYKGVYKTNNGTFSAAIVLPGRKKKHLGTFATDIEAAKAYDDAVREYWNGEGYLNFPDEK